MRDAVVDGTGKKANSPYYDLFGKTGTAQLPNFETGGYYDDRYVSSFLGGAPVDKPTPGRRLLHQGSRPVDRALRRDRCRPRRPTGRRTLAGLPRRPRQRGDRPGGADGRAVRSGRVSPVLLLIICLHGTGRKPGAWMNGLGQNVIVPCCRMLRAPARCYVDRRCVASRLLPYNSRLLFNPRQGIRLETHCFLQLPPGPRREVRRLRRLGDADPLRLDHR